MEYKIKKNIFCALSFLLFVNLSKADLETSEVSFIPEKYTIQILTKENHFDDSKETEFDGIVTINFLMKKPNPFEKTFSIILDSNAKTTVNKWSLQGVKDDGKKESITTCTNEKLNDKLLFKCPKESAIYNKFELQIQYTTPFGKDMTGFYRSSYRDSKGTRWLLTTHFEPIFARNAFPCFDRPNLKALFEIIIQVPNSVTTVLSNTPCKKTSSEQNISIYNCKPTEIPMSTYLVAFTASNLISTEPKTFTSDYKKLASTKTLTTYGRNEIISLGDGKMAQTVGVKAVEELTEYLGLGYALDKIDQVGIPDFSAGAMENWGHISFREKSLFFNEKKSSTTTKQSNVLTITHELVHQWFGNLVTLESWDYIWLNEAFATYIEYIIASKFKDFGSSTWNLLNQLVVNEIHLRAFETDGLTSSKPLTNKITDESLIFSSFNDIPYSKGAAVLRMWDLTLKDNGFQKSLKSYLANRKENSANPDHLYHAFQTQAQMASPYFKTWTEQPGYPVVEVKKINGNYELSQYPFTWEKSSEKTTWLIPISYSTKSSKNFDTLPSSWLSEKAVTINGTDKWIIVNNQQAGYYRVNYEEENWNALSEALSEKNHSSIPEVNRAQIINDVFSLARSLRKNYVNYSTALNLIKYLKNENSYVAWKTALNAFDFLNTKLYKDEIYEKFKQYVLSLVDSHFKTLNSQSQNHVEKLLNIEISRWSCSLDSEACVKEAKTLFNNLSYTNLPDTQEIILCTVVRNDDKTWDKIFDMYKKEEDSAVKIMYISALGCTNNETQAELFLNKTLAKSGEIRSQDLIYVLSSVYNGNMRNVDTALKFVDLNFKSISQNFGGINPLGKAVVGIAKRLNTAKQLEKLKALVKKIRDSPEGSAALESLENAVKITSSNVNWIGERMGQLKIYFNAGSYLSYSFGLLLLCFVLIIQF